MKKIGIICKSGKEKPDDILKKLLPWLLQKGYETFVDSETASQLNISGLSRDEISSVADMVIVFGGDGTMLSVSRLVAERGVPILGVNLGNLGFITEISRENVFNSMEKMLSGECVVEERMMLSARITRDGKQISESRVLNDVVINKGAIARIIDLETYINNVYVTTFKADGLIVSTPTGSTAYSLSAGGPILYPALESIILTPICSHTLTNRPLVVPDDFKLKIILKTLSEDVYLTLDGQVGVALRIDDVIEVVKSRFSTKLLIPKDRNYFEIIRTKLKWGER